MNLITVMLWLAVLAVIFVILLNTFPPGKDDDWE